MDVSNNQPTISLKEHLEAVMNERDRSYDGRFRAAEIAVNAALAAQEKAVTTAFLAAEKATLKAEEAQKVYNEGHNDVNRRMDEQYNRMMPREEANVKVKSGDDKIELLRNEVVALREYKSQSQGATLGRSAIGVYIISGISLLLSIILHFVK